MSKARHIFACTACGSVQTKWMGKCPECGAWDSLESERVEPKTKMDLGASAVTQWSAEIDRAGPATPTGARRITEIEPTAGPASRRIVTGIGEFDRVLGGGIVPGSAILIGGDPGIGKSTLLLQAAGALAAHGTRVLYVSSEESAEQVRMRAQRLGAAAQSELLLLAETSLTRLTEQAAKALADAPIERPPVLIIDSVQMVYRTDMESMPGSLAQLRRCCAELVQLAKGTGTAVLFVGHVTKDGQLAGPRMLEHLVDTVLYFEGDRYHAHRIIRAVKNRFGTTLELGLFEMTGAGLREAPHGASFAAITGSAARPGTVVCPVMTGTRCLMVEIQALTATGFLGAAKRKSSGLDASRLAMLIAILEQHAGLRLADRDIFASAVGGMRVGEPAADLALLLAIAGAHSRRSLPAGCAAVGEVGLGGEVRPVSQMESRLHEARRLGCTTLIVPAAAQAKTKASENLSLIHVKTIGEAIDHLA